MLQEKWRRLALYFYNFSSILCLKFENRTCKVSKLTTFLNVLKMPSVILLTAFMTFYTPIAEVVFQNNLLAMRNYSMFSKFSLLFVLSLRQLSKLILCILQVLQRHDIGRFMNCASTRFLGGNFARQFEKLFIKNLCVFGSLFTVISFLQYFGAFQISFPSLLAELIICYPNLVQFAFISFVKNVESFIIASLKEFQEDLNEILLNPKSKWTTEDAVRLSRRYQEIFNIAEQFNECVGSQITLMTCYFVLMLVLDVSHSQIVSDHTVVCLLSLFYYF